MTPAQRRCLLLAASDPSGWIQRHGNTGYWRGKPHPDFTNKSNWVGTVTVGRCFRRGWLATLHSAPLRRTEVCFITPAGRAALEGNDG